MRVLEINKEMPSYSVLADPDDIILFNGVAYRVIAGGVCAFCDVFNGVGCGCMPFDCLGSWDVTNDMSYILKRVVPEGGEND